MSVLFIKSPTLPKVQSPDPKYREKASAAPSFAASLTVEASVLLPAFLLTIYLFWTFFTALQFHVRLQASMDQVTAWMAQQSYLTEAVADRSGTGAEDGEWTVSGVLRSAAWKITARGSLLKSLGRETLQAAPLEKGSAGLSVAASTWNRKGDICLVVRYRLTFPGLPGKLLKLPVEQVSRRKCWTGKNGSGRGGDGAGEEGGETVYVAETGRVYHRDIQCYHLNVTIRTVSFGTAKAARNNSGGRYRPCEHCAVSAGAVGTVYITPEGDRYHVTRDCSGLKRTVHTEQLSRVSLPPCSHCGMAQAEDPGG